MSFGIDDSFTTELTATVSEADKTINENKVSYNRYTFHFDKNLFKII